jgi:DNA polymerase
MTDGHISNVFSTMNPAAIMVVGQNPGKDEVESAIPFCGTSGKIFDEALERIAGLKRSDVYFTNVVKCQTPENRKPTEGEIAACRRFLDIEVEIVQPLVMVALGSYALKVLTGMSGVMKHCGEVLYSIRYGIYVVATLHPSPFNTNVPERLVQFEEGLKSLAKLLRDKNG